MIYLREVAGHSQADREVRLPAAPPAGEAGGARHPVAGVAGHSHRLVCPGDLGVGDCGARTVPGLAVRQAGPPQSSLTPELAPAGAQSEPLGTHHLDGRPLRRVVLGALHHRHPGQGGVQLRAAGAPLDT